MHSTTVPAAILAALFLTAAEADASHPLDPHWTHVALANPQGPLDGPVRCMIGFEGDLIVGGEFVTAGNEVLNRIGRWDGEHWEPLGAGFDDAVLALTVFEGRLVAGGNFRFSARDTMNYVALWNGAEWEPLWPGFDATVHALGEWEGKLLAGGSFLRTGEVDGWGVHTSEKNTLFTALWDGVSWESMGDKYSSSVHAFGKLGGRLFSGRHMRNSESQFGISTWDTSGNWVPSKPEYTRNNFFFLQFRRQRVWKALAFLNVEDRLLAAGALIDSLGANQIYAFDGHEWSPFGPPTDGSIKALTFHDGHIVAAGVFRTAGGTPAGSIAILNGEEWESPGGGVDAGSGCETNSAVNAVASYRGELYAGGKFSCIGGNEISHLAVWRGGEWRALLPTPEELALERSPGSPVLSLHEHEGKLLAGLPGLIEQRDDGRWTSFPSGPEVSNPRIISSGFFASWTDATSIATWQGGVYRTEGYWSPRLYGMGEQWTDITPPNSNIHALFPTPSGLLCGAQLRVSPSVTTNNVILRWDGASWTQITDDLLLHPKGYCRINEVIIHDGNIIAASNAWGSCWDCTSSPWRIARWDGSAWIDLGDGLNEHIADLVIYRDELYAGGAFTHSGSTATPFVARWDGERWHPVGNGPDGPVLDLEVYTDRLIAGGLFKNAGDLPANRLAAWDGTTWVPLGSGVDGAVNALAVHNGDLVVGGEFLKAGGEMSPYFARWRDGSSTAEFAELSATRTGEGALVRWSASHLPRTHLGFHVYRQPALRERTLISESLLQGSDTFLDRDVPIGEVDYWLAGIGYSGLLETWYGPFAVGPSPELVLQLAQGTPNPFTEASRIAFETPALGQVTVSVYDLQGREVAGLLDDVVPAGRHETAWDGRSRDGTPVAAGLYFVRLVTRESVLTRRIVKQ